MASWQSVGAHGAVARVVSLSGFGGRRAGEAIAVDAGGGVAGSLLGGAANGAVLAAARGLTPARPAEIVEVPIGDPEAVAAGLACGGLARLLVQHVAQLPEGLWTSLVERRPVAVVTALAGTETGTGGSLIVEEAGAGDAEPLGTFGSARLREAALDAARELLRAGRDASLVLDHEDGTVFVEAFVPPSRTVVVAEPSALAGALGDQAGLLGWEHVALADLREALDAIEDLRSRDAVVVLSHDPELDTPALEAALRGTAYVGALGSRHTQAARRERLTARGVPADVVDRIHGPVGLDLGSRTPEETAVAIFAEILAWRSGRGAASLRDGEGPING